MFELFKITTLAKLYMSLAWQVNNFCNFHPDNWSGDIRKYV